MVMLNDLDRFHLVMDVIDRVPGLARTRRAPAAADGRRPAGGPGLHPRARRGRPGDHAAGPGRQCRRAARRGADPGRQRRVEQPRSCACSTPARTPSSRPAADLHRWAATLGGGADAPRSRRAIDVARPGRTRSGTGSCTAARSFTGAGRGRRRRSGSGSTTLTDLAPLHQPKSLAALDAVQRACCPTCPPWPASTPRSTPRSPRRPRRTRCPREWRDALGAAPLRLPRPVPRLRAPRRAAGAARPRPRAGLRVVTCHLGAGASLAAVHGGHGRSTPRWASRRWKGWSWPPGPASVDPGLVLWLEEHAHMPPARARGRPGAPLRACSAWPAPRDMREVAGARRRPATRAPCSAVDVYLHRLRGAHRGHGRGAWAGSTRWCSPAASARTRPEIRSRAADGLGFLGVAVDPASNDSGTGRREISAPGRSRAHPRHRRARGYRDRGAGTGNA